MNHPVGRFVLPLFQHRDAGNFDFICFSCAPTDDHVSREMQRHSHGWHHTSNLNDVQLAQLIVENGIDILIDLAGHTSGGRLLVFACRPAPVQVSYLGYANSTGLETIDYRITDHWADPVGESDSLHTEKLIRLPQSFLCFTAPSDAPSIGPAPANETGRITFGSFNYLPKISKEIAEIWRRVLDAVPGSRLRIKSRHLDDHASREDVFQLLKSYGLQDDRMMILPRELNPAMHMTAYRELDIALDTFPYHGTTTTCEALWMGVPVVTLAGATHVSRVGVSLLQNAGMPQLIANSADEYVQIAAALARDIERLNEFRAHARERLQASPLMDAPTFARDMQNAFRRMWRTWCARA